MTITELSLDSLRQGHTIITPDSAGYFIENCKVCFHNQNHTSGVKLRVQYDESTSFFRVVWQGDVTSSMLRAWGKEQKTNTEVGAIALTMLLMAELTNYQAIAGAGYGTGMDYALTDQPQDEMMIFNEITAFLEITGIATQTRHNTVNERISEKKSRVDRVRGKSGNLLGSLPAIISCVEFGTPWVRIITYE